MAELWSFCDFDLRRLPELQEETDVLLSSDSQDQNQRLGRVWEQLLCEHRTTVEQLASQQLPKSMDVEDIANFDLDVEEHQIIFHNGLFPFAHQYVDAHSAFSQCCIRVRDIVICCTLLRIQRLNPFQWTEYVESSPAIEQTALNFAKDLC